MAADFTPFSQVLKARLPAAMAGHDTAHFASVGTIGTIAPTAQRSGDTALFPKPQPHSASSVELKREGDRITQIRVHCRCGEVIEIDCEY